MSIVLFTFYVQLFYVHGNLSSVGLGALLGHGVKNGIGRVGYQLEPFHINPISLNTRA